MGNDDGSEYSKGGLIKRKSRSKKRGGRKKRGGLGSRKW
jgi:hypothetical protein